MSGGPGSHIRVGDLVNGFESPVWAGAEPGATDGLRVVDAAGENPPQTPSFVNCGASGAFQELVLPPPKSS